MDIRFFPGKSVRPTLLSLACIVGLSLASCADDDIASDTKGDRGTAVSFNVSDAQYDARQPAGAPTRAAFAESLAQQDLTPEDLTVQKLPVQGGDGNACLIETTVAGTNPVRPAGAPTRANITTTATLGNFSTTAYRGATAATIGTTPWFYNRETKPDGTLAQPVLWAFDQPFARFFAVSPQVTDGYAKLVLSPESHGGTPYVDFEAETDVKKQKDLMTACSGLVHYATQYVAPTANLAFRHALTAVRFKVGQNLSWNKTITKVEIRNAMSRGRYTLSAEAGGDGARWDNLQAPQTFTLSGLSVSTSKAVNQVIMGNNGDNYTFYMIPQPLQGVSVYVEFSDGTDITASLAGTWKPGTTKTYALSENNSTWEYVLTTTSPAAAYYDATATGAYTVQSYRRDPATGTQQPVAWKVVGYQESTDDGKTFGKETTTKPKWLTALSMESGEGGTVALSGTSTIAQNFVDSLALYNKVLQEAAQRGSAGAPYDLSLHDFKGRTTPRNTANSYLVSAPGYYSIPLVYGNAVTAGQVNSHAYMTTNTQPGVLRRFKDHAGKDISSAYINVQNKDNPATQASIVWTDQSGIVDNLSVTVNGASSYLNFHVPADKIRNGNAVIAVKNASGTVMWSWHLWFDHDDVLTTIPCTNYQGHTYDFTKQTLGFAYRRWLGSASVKPRVARVRVEQTVAGAPQSAYIDIRQNPGSIQEVSSTFYQFGRKDAMPGVKPVSDGSFTMKEFSTNGLPPQEYIQHPGTYFRNENIYGKSDLVYADTLCVNLWSMDHITKLNLGVHMDAFNDKPVVKTVYDPCPAGFKMPAPNATTGFSNNKGNVEDLGTGATAEEVNGSGVWSTAYDYIASNYMLYSESSDYNPYNFRWILNNKITNPDATVTFIGMGYYNYQGYETFAAGQIGYYWSACAMDKTHATCFTFSYEGFHSRGYQFMADGLNVRPVADK